GDTGRTNSSGVLLGWIASAVHRGECVRRCASPGVMSNQSVAESIPLPIGIRILVTEGVAGEGNALIVAAIGADAEVLRDASAGGGDGVAGEGCIPSRCHS